MENFAAQTSSIRSTNKHPTSGTTHFAVYDCSSPKNIADLDVAFIEERLGEKRILNQHATDEMYFYSLTEAKAYVNEHFQSGAEYFSLKQSTEPDNLFYVIVDKIAYLIA